MTFQQWWDSTRIDTEVPFEGTASCFAKAAWDVAMKQSEPEPHACVDCRLVEEVKGLGWYCTNDDVPIFGLDEKKLHKLWLCGHWQKKA